MADSIPKSECECAPVCEREADQDNARENTPCRVKRYVVVRITKAQSFLSHDAVVDVLLTVVWGWSRVVCVCVWALMRVGGMSWRSVPKKFRAGDGPVEGICGGCVRACVRVAVERTARVCLMRIFPRSHHTANEQTHTHTHSHSLSLSHTRTQAHKHTHTLRAVARPSMRLQKPHQHCIACGLCTKTICSCVVL
jgi:hypothetical protein